ncbi:MAG: proprotein convertase P-domain-containing protein, partial [Acidobacteriota bacterium]
MKTRHLWPAALSVLVLSVAVSAELYTTSDAAAPITDNGGALNDCQTISVPDNLVISDVEVEITAAHTFAGDLTFELTSPAATALTLVNRPGRTGTGFGNGDDLQDATPLRFSDSAPSGASAETMGDAPCGGPIDGSADCPDNYLPAPDAADVPVAGQGTDFSDFAGESSMGVWTLCASDSAGGDTGTLTSWTLGVNEAVPVELMG